MITLDKLDSACQSIAIKSSTGNELNIDGNGYLTVKGSGSFEVVSGGLASWKTTNTSLTTAAELVGTPLSGRVKITIQNFGPDDAYVTDTGPATNADLCIPCGASWTENLDENADIFAISDGTSSLRIAEYAA